MSIINASPARGPRFLLAFSAAVACLGSPDPARACHHDHDDDDGALTTTVVASFDPSLAETPESIAIDSHDNIYVNLALTGEIRKISRHGVQSTFAQLPMGAPPGTFCGVFFAGLTGLAIDGHDNLYVSLASCDPASRGVWKIAPNGHQMQLTTLPMSSLPNGIAYRDRRLYVADSALGVIWTLSAKHPGVAEVWADDPLLAPVDPQFPGPNGVQFFEDELYVSNTGSAQILAFGMEHDGSAGDVRVHAEGAMCDDFAFDVEGALYCGTDPLNTLVRFAPDGTMDVLLTAEDGLDGATAAIFGRRGGDRRDLYITNASFPFFPTSAGTPSLLKVDLGVRGYPRF